MSMSDEDYKAVLRDIETFGSSSAAARARGVPDRTFRRQVQRAKEMFGDVPVKPVAGTSTLFDRDGKQVLQWVKSDRSKERIEELRNTLFAALTDRLPTYEAVQPPEGCAADLLTLYVLTDMHIGMYAWKEETGAEDWDMKKAESLLIAWFRMAIDHAPASERCVFANLGDFLHWDGLDAITPMHGNLLDADTRFAKLVRVAIRVVRQVIKMLLGKHQEVHVIMADSNHDPASSIWLREWLAAVYEDEPRITIEQSADSYYCVEHGATSLFFHHGHKRKVNNVDDVFTAKFRDVFGRTKHSYAHLGHLHSDEVLETPLMKVERHRTLAPPDAYASKGGWVSGRDSKAITYHKQFGEVHRMTINPELARQGV